MQRRRWLVQAALPAVIILIIIACCGDGNAALYKSYVFNFWGEPVPTPDPYLPVRTVSGTDLGVGEFKNAQYVFTAPDNTLYIVDTGNNRIIRTAGDFSVIEIIQEFERDGKTEKFNNPQSVFVTRDGRLFVADTQNERIVAFDADGDFDYIIDRPITDSPEALPEHFRFRPKRIAVDPVNRLYITVEGVYDGIMELTTDGEFRGFMGAPRVTRSAWEIFWFAIATKEQRERMRLLLPTEFSAMSLDEMGFIYATVAPSEEGTTLFIRKLSPAGADVLRRQGFSPPMGDIYEGTSSAIVGYSKLVDIIGRENGMYSALDQLRGRVFTYDNDGNLLYVFGGVGPGIGLFTSPSSLTELDGRLLVLDSRGANCITVFEPTAYANAIHTAVYYRSEGLFAEAAEAWRLVMSMNPNFELAYSGVADAYMWDGDYRQAMYYFRLGNNRAGYSKAFYRYRHDWVNANFGKIMTFALILFALIYTANARAWIPRLRQRYTKTRMAAWFVRTEVQQNPVYAWLKRTWYSLCYARHVMFHPFDGFWDLKYEKRGTVAAATTLLVLTVLAYVFMVQYTGFVLNYGRPENVNIVREAISILIPFFLWTAVNWALTTLMDGKGTMKDIYIAAAFSLTPFLLAAVPLTVVSNYITAEEARLFALVFTIPYVWTFALLFLGTGLIHDYSLGKIVFTTAATIVGIGFACFVGLLFFDVLDRMLRFVQEVYREISLRL